MTLVSLSGLALGFDLVYLVLTLRYCSAVASSWQIKNPDSDIFLGSFSSVFSKRVSLLLRILWWSLRSNFQRIYRIPKCQEYLWVSQNLSGIGVNWVEKSHTIIMSNPGLHNGSNGWYDPLIQYQAYYNFTIYPGVSLVLECVLQPKGHIS